MDTQRGKNAQTAQKESLLLDISKIVRAILRLNMLAVVIAVGQLIDCKRNH